MKYHIVGEQQAFFTQNKSIEFEGLLSDERVAQLKKAVNKIQKSDENYKRDLFRKDPEIKRVVLSAAFAEIGAELIASKQLRIGFDELYELPQKKSVFKSSIQGLACCLMLCIEGECDKAPNKVSGDGSIDPFPHKPGSGIYFLPNVTWDMSSISNRQYQRFILIAYAQDPAIFKLEEEDKHTHFLKQFGYVFGDKLNDVYHPVLYKKIR